MSYEGFVAQNEASYLYEWIYSRQTLATSSARLRNVISILWPKQQGTS